MNQKQAYRYRWLPKIVTSDSFDFHGVFCGPVIVDDPQVLRKTAGSKVVDQWGDVEAPKGHSLVHVIALGATETTSSNRNGDGFRSEFLKRAHPTFMQYGALYRDHQASDYSKRSGDILKTAYNDDMGRVELLVSANHEKCADFLSDIDRGRRRDVSMGFDCETEQCSICGHKSHVPKERCQHTRKGAKFPFGLNRILEDGRKIYLDNPSGHFNDISMVPVGADMIAQHLRKISSLDGSEEVVSGSELAEMYLKQASIDTSVKIALAHKLSRIEKIIPAVAIRPEHSDLRMPAGTVDKLRRAEPDEMFGELAKTASVLDFRSFFQLVMGQKFAEIAPWVDAAESQLPGLFSDIAEDPDRLDRVVRNSQYDAAKRASALLSPYDNAILASEFSIDPDIATSRLVHRACGGGGKLIQHCKQASPDAPTLVLLDQYAAYKLAALEAIPMEMTDAVMMAAVMTT